MEPDATKRPARLALAGGSLGGVPSSRIGSAADVAAVAIVVMAILLLGIAARQMTRPLEIATAPIDLSVRALPFYTLCSVARMLAALAVSLAFTLVYATLAAKSRRAEMILIPLLDALQSVPVLGYLSFTVVFFLSMAPGSELGAELASIFAIFTAQAWNMTFSLYQSLRTVPSDLDEASRSLRESAWQRFWRLEVPFAMPGLIWNTMMSMSGSWFFVVASEAIDVGNTHLALPGLGSYVEHAIEQRDLGAIGWAIAAMSIAIVLYDQLLFRPLVAWSDKFRVEQSASQSRPQSWFLQLLGASGTLAALWEPLRNLLGRFATARFREHRGIAAGSRIRLPPRVADALWYAALVTILAELASLLARRAAATLRAEDFTTVAVSGAITLLRVLILTFLASLVWVPIGIYVGLRPRLTQFVQPFAQFLAAFPANLLFPVAVYGIVRYELSPSLWLSPLMILGTQWYILFNVIAGASTFPADLRDAAASLRLPAFSRWRQVLLPGIFPYYVTGAITAAGGAWNASIVAETVSWGDTRLTTRGLGSYIAEQTRAGQYDHIALGVAMMSVLVVIMNRGLWRPLYAFAERRTRLE